ncbi:pilus assembly protein TadG-related protein [Streptomyces sp. BK239]|uniref:pilus assembly protein TadG-related protein n=1 Tax=Streptomyces sp. BK239 TaxID=2512155 RepID=UPI00102B640F|nr:pilus assembly protein TadG-related protein [Streptomyces sp. BK239]
MSQPRLRSDAGQVFPIYITVVAGLLFVAFAFFAVGQAAVKRNEAQTAADAAALAAAQETRDELADLWVLAVLDPTKWQDIFDGDGGSNRCERAVELAAMNDATAQCSPDGPLSYRVEVATNKPIGESVVPGTAGRLAHAEAVAVIEPLCDPPGQIPPGNGLPTLNCDDDVDWVLDPADLTDLPAPEDLFDVHLADG